MGSEAYCDCTGAPPWPGMMRLHGGGPNRFYLCRACGAVREDVYREGAIVEHRWHEGPNGELPPGVREEALEVLGCPAVEQLSLWPGDGGS
jgi:hypothetical protein